MGSKTLLSKITYQGRAFDVRQDTIELPDGRSAQLDIVAHSGAVTILPVDPSGQIWFVRQYRHAAGKTLLELPAGTLEKGESPEECAGREIREEIGMAAAVMEHIAEFYLAPGYSTEYMHVFLAKELTPSPLAQDADEFLSVEQFSIEDVYSLAQSGGIQDAKTLAALFLARPWLSVAGS
jgi:ADP-ribose pyrophosphatase